MLVPSLAAIIFVWTLGCCIAVLRLKWLRYQQTLVMDAHRYISQSMNQSGPSAPFLNLGGIMGTALPDDNSESEFAALISSSNGTVPSSQCRSVLRPASEMSEELDNMLGDNGVRPRDRRQTSALPPVGTSNNHLQDVKWRRLSSLLLEKEIFASPDQVRGKWESVMGNYKKVKDWNKRSGVEPFSSMTRRERTANKLPTEFSEEWADMIDSFYGQRATIVPPCMVESVEPVENIESPWSDADHAIETNSPTEEIVHQKGNSGIKRKNKTNSKSITMISEAIEKIGTSIVAVEDRRDVREEKQVAHNGHVANAFAQIASLFKDMAAVKRWGDGL